MCLDWNEIFGLPANNHYLTNNNKPIGHSQHNVVFPDEKNLVTAKVHIVQRKEASESVS